jgi:putative endonuclease
MDGYPPKRRSAAALGREFEDAAAAYLVARGHTLLGRNVRFGHKEVDLVVRCHGVTCFVEVKGRRGSGSGHPLEAITTAKRREIEAVARWWIRTHPGGGPYRFDAVAVVAQDPDPRRWQVSHVPDAWRPGLP